MGVAAGVHGSIAEAWQVDVRQGIQIHALGSGVGQRQQHVFLEFPLDRGAPEMRVGGLDVLGDRAQAHSRQRFGSGASRQRSGVRCRHRNRGNVRTRGQSNHRIVGWVLNYVKGDVAEIPLVSDTVAAAQASFTVAENIPCKAQAWSEISVVLTPKAPHRAVPRKLHSAGPELLLERAAGTEIIIGI